MLPLAAQGHLPEGRHERNGLMNRRGWTGVLLLFVTALLGGLVNHTTPVRAQRNPPGGLDEATLRSYGTRHVLPLAGGTGKPGFLRVTNVGWTATHVIAVELAPSGSPRCDVGTESTRIKAVTCHKSLGRWATVELALSGQDSSVMLFSLDAAQVPDPCGAFQAVRSGQTTLAAWERETHAAKRGEPMAVLLVDQQGTQRLTLVGQTGLPSNVLGQRMEAVRGLAAVPSARQGQRLRVFNGGANCNPVALRQGSANAKAADCRPAQAQNLDVSGYDARDLRPSLGDQPGGLTLSRSARDKPPAADLAVGLEMSEAKGGYRLAAPISQAATGAPLAFPLAVGPMTEQASELFITNLHITATVKIAVTMYDGNGAVQRLYNDPEALCAGATRRYDIQALAGTIPLTTGRGGGQQRPPYLSLRAEATSAELPDFGPLAGTMIIRAAEGIIAYAGMTLPAEGQVFRPRIDKVDGNSALVAVVPDVKKNWGPDRVSTYLSIMNLQAPHPENIVTIDFYDEAGNLVLNGVERAINPVAFLDTQEAIKRGVNNGGATPTPGAVETLPDGFRGTALIRGQRIPGTLLGVVAVEHRTNGVPSPRTPLMLAGPLSISGSVLLPSWADPSLPTPTARPRVTATPGGMTPGPGTGTPSRPTPGAGTGTPIRPGPTTSATAVEPTPTAPVPTQTPAGGRVLLPALLTGSTLSGGQ